MTARIDLKASRRKLTATRQPTLDRTPPNAPQMEIGVLGCQLLDPNQCVNDFIQRFRDGALVHYDLRHQVIQAALLEMFEERRPISVITVQQYLKDRGELDQIGGLPYLIQIEDVPSAANFSYYAQIVEEKYTLRRLIKTCSEIVGRVYDSEEKPERLLEQAEQEILKIRTNPVVTKDIRELMSGAIDLVEKRATNWDLITGLSTGLPDLDRMTDGLHGGEFIVIAAQTSCGKTALALNVAIHNALAGVSSAFCSAEMRPVRLAIRALCSEARVNFKEIGERDIMRIMTVIGKLSNSPIRLESVNGYTIGQVRALARRLKQQYGIKLLVIENIQLLIGEGDSRQERISNISCGMKGIALELDIAVIGLSQLNDDDKLRESRAIGHDADSVWIIKNDGAWQPETQPAVLNIEKSRDGQTGKVPVTFLKTITRFEQAAKFSNEDIPTNHND